jgi:extracellular factor (EF) 3-hydroxypalmitic acid methyl ester biosynthesis protein
LQIFLHDLRLWMSHAELKLHAQADSTRKKFERNVLDALLPHIIPVLGSLFEKFEKSLPESEKPFDGAYALYAKRLLHQLVLGAPFMRRTFEKPLGYAGDYEMVNMMIRDPFEGDSLFAKVLNTFFIETPPVVAHRNRIAMLLEYLKQEVSARSIKRQPTRIFNLGCGPAIEIQRFLADFRFSDSADFMLLDFNDETVAYARNTLEKIAGQHNRDCMIRVIKKSVAQLLKDNSQFQRGHYDLVYCAGLFDYLADPVCKQLVELFYELAAPGGLVLITNVHVNNPSRGWMEYMVDWHLEYRDAAQMAAILPTSVSKDQTRILIEPSGVNIFAEIRKP